MKHSATHIWLSLSDCRKVNGPCQTYPGRGRASPVFLQDSQEQSDPQDMMAVCGSHAIKQLPRSNFLGLKCREDPVWPLTSISVGHRTSVGSLSSTHRCLTNRRRARVIRQQHAGKVNQTLVYSQLACLTSTWASQCRAESCPLVMLACVLNLWSWV